MNIFVNVPVPVGNGSGAPVSLADFGLSKTISVAGPFVAAVTIEISNQLVPTQWAPLITFNNPDGIVLRFAARWVRASVSGYKSGVPACDIGGSDDGTLFANLPVTAADGTGPAVDVSSLPLVKTVTVGGPFRGSVQIEVSEDGSTDWSQLGFGFTNPGQKTQEMTARFMRVVRDGVPQIASGTPIVDVGACSNGGDSGSVGPLSLIYRPGSGLSGPVVFDDWHDLMAKLNAMRAAANGSGYYIVQSDSRLVFPLPAVVPPGGPYDFTNVLLQGTQQIVELGPTVNRLDVSDGATFIGLRNIRSIHLVNHNMVTPMDSSLARGDIITAILDTHLQNDGAAPMWRLPPGSAAGLGMLISAAYATQGAVVDVGAGAFFAFANGAGSRLDGTAVSGPASATVQLGRQSSGTRLASVYPAFAGSLAVDDDSWTAASILRPTPFGGGPLTGATNLQFGAFARADVSVGPFALTLPPLSTDTTSQAFNPGSMIAISETSGTAGLIVAPSAGDTIDGSIAPIAVPAGGIVLLINDAFSDWRVLSGLASEPVPDDPAKIAQYTENFINLDAVTTVAIGGGTATLQEGLISSFVGDCQLASNANGDGVAVNTSDSKLFMDMRIGLTTFQGRAQPVFGPPTALNDYRLILGFCNDFSPGVLGQGAYFLAGFAENGNANWWAVLDDGVPLKADTGVAVNTGGPPQTFRMDFNPSIPGTTGATFYIDGVQVAFIAHPAAVYPTIGLVGKYFDISRGGDSCQLDWLSFYKDLR